jgi:hypothetical protein
MSGEKKDRRKAIDKMVRQMVQGGANHTYAKKKAVKAAQDYDRKKRKP